MSDAGPPPVGLHARYAATAEWEIRHIVKKLNTQYLRTHGDDSGPKSGTTADGQDSYVLIGYSAG